jgi:hypothetical protein
MSQPAAGIYVFAVAAKTKISLNVGPRKRLQTDVF